MATPHAHVSQARSVTVPLLDASDLPAADDWALLESLQAEGDFVIDAEPDFDRFGRLRLTAAFDE
jgi:hypothetical protein